MALLGEDGRGYELARKLETCGVWRSWLGDSYYTNFIPFLSSSSSWENFMKSGDLKSRAQMHLQLRVRALLYDKASVSLFLPSDSSSSSSVVSKINPAYLQLHGDDIYMTYEDVPLDETWQQEGTNSSSIVQSKAMQNQLRMFCNPCKQNEHSSERPSNNGLRCGDHESQNHSKRQKTDELPDTWYQQFVDRYKASRKNKLSYGDKETQKRTPEGMSIYLRCHQRHKKQRLAFKDEQSMGFSNSVQENRPNFQPIPLLDGKNNLLEDTTCFFPEMMFPANCVPDCALPPRNFVDDNKKQGMELYGILDTIPNVMTQNAAMMERLGVNPEHLKMGFARNNFRVKNDGDKELLSPDQAILVSKKVIAHVLENVGLDGSTETSMDVLAQFFSAHINHLGRVLKVLTDSYRKRFSAIELIKMFLQITGNSLGALAEHLKCVSSKAFPPTTQQQHARAIQSHNSLIQAQQMQKQLSSPMHMLQPQNLAYQQWDKMRRRQASTPRGPGMMVENVRPMLEVKVENTSDIVDNMMNRQQMQVRQQMLLNNLQSQAANQFKQVSSFPTQVQPQNTSNMRPQPVKVEGFQELMGGDSTTKHEPVTSPSK